MNERHKLQADLKRYGTLRGQLTDGRIIAVIEQFIRETEARLAELGIIIAGRPFAPIDP
jgi:hypothetical protein